MSLDLVSSLRLAALHVRLRKAWAPWFGGSAALLHSRRALRRARARAGRLPAEGRVPHRLRACAERDGCRSWCTPPWPIAAAVGLIWRIKVAHAVAAAARRSAPRSPSRRSAPASLWGGPMWGTYWEWDPRLTSELVLLFLYFGYMGLRAAIDDPQRADSASAVLADRRRRERADHSLSRWSGGTRCTRRPRDEARRSPPWPGRCSCRCSMMLLGFHSSVRRAAARAPAGARCCAANALPAGCARCCA